MDYTLIIFAASVLFVSLDAFNNNKIVKDTEEKFTIYKQETKKQQELIIKFHQKNLSLKKTKELL